jgi:hypothetical protein
MKFDVKINGLKLIKKMTYKLGSELLKLSCQLFRKIYRDAIDQISFLNYLRSNTTIGF